MNSQIEIIQKAATLIDRRKYLEAKEILLNYKKENKNIKLYLEFYYTLYLVTNFLNERQNSKKYLEKCLKINEKNHVVLNNLGNIFFREGNTHKAEEFYLRSLKLKNDYLIVIINLAILYQNLGKFLDSKKFYQRAIELSPKQISLYSNLSRIDKNFINEDKINYISDLMKNSKLELSEMSYGYFLLADFEKKRGNFSKEILYLDKGNQCSFESKLKANKLTLNYWQNIIPKKYNNFIFKNQNKSNEFKNFEPIFIIGLPRSGSTIIDVLLSSSNRNIKSLGEANIFNGIIAKGFSKDEGNLIDLDIVKKKISNIFLERNYNINNQIFIDKSLENFFYIDVILEIFPKAKFINSIRNLEDNIFAIYTASLAKLSWTHSLDNIISYIDNYNKIINYFYKKYPNKILKINLEDLSNKPIDISKKIYSFCNLEWSDKILEFQKRKDLLISTASNIQLRESIKKYNFEKYSLYKKLLKNFTKEFEWINLKIG